MLREMFSRHRFPFANLFAVALLTALSIAPPDAQAQQTQPPNNCWHQGVNPPVANCQVTNPTIFSPSKAVLTDSQGKKLTAVSLSGLKPDDPRWSYGKRTTIEATFTNDGVTSIVPVRVYFSDRSQVGPITIPHRPTPKNCQVVGTSKYDNGKKNYSWAYQSCLQGQGK